MMVGAKGFAAKVWVFESVDMSGMDTLSRTKGVKFVHLERGRAKKRG